jgi:hypothetical protein
MGILDSISDAIFGKANASPTHPPGGDSATKAASADNANKTASADNPIKPSTQPSAEGGDSPKPQATVDVAAVLNDAVAAKKQKLNWRTSIVDLMKALDLDSSLQSRKQLAKELQYTGDTNDSAKMNVWLHKALMTKLDANGGKVPADLRD